MGFEEAAAESRWTQRQPERVGLNSWNNDNSYSEHEQHRGTARGGSR
ncbi:hypothetical protein STRTUCAR8_06739 [Streptomyces turgidiscabies Car8]|uniref:Uncharacterized protein n=1 Tax=Streptomyces turgidiscabies (strain Car8) TaxID=698760 RepID=L7F1F7_STRT8|nr:hypothetical protein STRTUCAR8_06739 [Streptomyces turgidiscabies Car8]